MRAHSAPEVHTTNSQMTTLASCVQALRRTAWALFGFSGLVNLLALAVSLYLMQIFDRVLTSNSKDTLAFLTLAVVVALVLSAGLDLVRLLIANRAGAWLAARSAPALLHQAIGMRNMSASQRNQPLRDLAVLKGFLSTPVPFNLCDAIWIPVYLLIIFLMHPMLGMVALSGILVLVGLVYLNHRITRPAFEQVQAENSINQQNADRLMRNVEVIEALGMTAAVTEKWLINFRQELKSSLSAQDIASWVIASSKLLRLLLQVALLAVGTVLVLDLKITGGVMIAASILVGRLLAPVEAAVGQWRQFVLARQSYARLIEFQEVPAMANYTVDLPPPTGGLVLKGLGYVPAGLSRPVLRNISLDVAAGETLAVIGPSASGKTTLARMLIGAQIPTVGHVRMDGAEVSKWPRAMLGKHIGYMPQHVELFPDTIYANIARFEIAGSEEVIEAAKMAGCHEMILALADGYETVLHENANMLSGGQLQRIGLARALFRQPRLIVLDEPNAHLDGAGETALLQAMRHLKQAGQTIVFVAHRASLLRAADKILVLQEGQIQHFGSRDDVMRAMGWLPDAQATDSAANTSRDSRTQPLVSN
jgi:ATP-binding cassette, subfamily C, bacterial exporter for protease/lipase